MLYLDVFILGALGQPLSSITFFLYRHPSWNPTPPCSKLTSSSYNTEVFNWG